jgi:hypothetical protein
LANVEPAGINQGFGKIFPKDNWRLFSEFAQKSAANAAVPDLHSFCAYSAQFIFGKIFPKRRV